MATDYPLITIGLTCFNAENTISRAIESALKQDWPNFEILIVDDASSDNSLLEIEPYLKKCPNVYLYTTSFNKGAAAARNLILGKAKGDFIAFFDDDDISYPHRLSTQARKLIEYENHTDTTLIVCYASGVRRYSNGYELRMPAIGSKMIIPTGDIVVDYLLFNRRKRNVFYGAGTPTCAVMARLSTFHSVGGFDDNLRRVEDVDLAIRLACIGGHFIGCEEQLFLQSATFTDDKTPEKNLDAELYLINKHSDYLRARNRYNYSKDWFRIRFYHFSGNRLKFFLALILFLLKHPFSGAFHLIKTIPARWLHERAMRRST